MRAQTKAVCEWSGVEPDADEIATCGRPAVGYVSSRGGGRVYACVEHVVSAKAHAQSGGWRSLAGRPTWALESEPLHPLVEVVD